VIFETDDQSLFSGDDVVLRPSLSGFRSGGGYLESLGAYFDADLGPLTFNKEIVYADGTNALVVTDSASIVMMAGETGSLVSTAEAELFLGDGDYVLSSTNTVSLWIDVEAPPKSVDLTDVSSDVEILLISEPGNVLLSASISDGDNLVIDNYDISIALSLSAETSIVVSSPWSDESQTLTHVSSGSAIVEPVEVITAELDEVKSPEVTVVDPKLSGESGESPSAMYPEIAYEDDFMLGPIPGDKNLGSFDEIELNLMSFDDLDAGRLSIQVRSDPLSVVYDDSDVPAPESIELNDRADITGFGSPKVDVMFGDLTPTEMVWEEPDDFIL